MPDLASLANEPAAVTIQGKEYRVGAMRARDIGYLERWFRESVPDPRVEARKVMDGLHTDTQKFIWERALADAKSWPPTFGSEEASRLVRSSEGIDRMIYLALRQGIAGFTLGDAEKLADAMTTDELMALLSAFSPQVATDAGEGGDDPKAGEPAP